MHESPRLRRLRSDLAAMERLQEESSVLRFRASGKPVQQYLIEFHGKGLARLRGKVAIQDRHQVEIKLGSSYPRTMPEIRWLTPIYHPNISEIGMVCLGGYGTHWVPSLNLDELCGMLWDMARFHNYDVRSPYNRDAALWVANQTTFKFPTDARPLRDLRVALGRVEGPAHVEAVVAEVEPQGAVAQTTGSKASRYVDFVRKLADDLRAPKPTTAGLGPSPAPSGENAVESPGIGERDDLIILDDAIEVETPTAPMPIEPTHRLRASGEDILFLD